MSEELRKPGRPRKWASEAERKRAYRRRRALELADPIAMREAARAARTEARSSLATAEAARREADRWQAKAAAAERRAQDMARRAAREKAAARRAFAERDDARRLLRRKLHWASDAHGLRNDPDALLALVAELYEQRAILQKELASVRQQLRRMTTDSW